MWISSSFPAFVVDHVIAGDGRSLNLAKTAEREARLRQTEINDERKGEDDMTHGEGWISSPLDNNSPHQDRTRIAR